MPQSRAAQPGPPRRNHIVSKETFPRENRTYGFFFVFSNSLAHPTDIKFIRLSDVYDSFFFFFTVHLQLGYRFSILINLGR